MRKASPPFGICELPLHYLEKIFYMQNFSATSLARLLSNYSSQKSGLPLSHRGNPAMIMATFSAREATI